MSKTNLIAILIGFAAIAIAGCAPPSGSTATIWLLQQGDYPDSAWEPYRGKPTVYKEIAKGFYQTKSGEKFLIWQGQYRSPFDLYKNPLYQYFKNSVVNDCIFAIPVVDLGKFGKYDIPLRTPARFQGFAGCFTPSVRLFLSDNATYQQTDGQMSVSIEGALRGVQYRILPSLNKWQAEPDPPWDTGFAKIHITWTAEDESGEAASEAAKAILAENYLRLTDDGKLEVATPD